MTINIIELQIAVPIIYSTSISYIVKFQIGKYFLLKEVSQSKYI